MQTQGNENSADWLQRFGFCLVSNVMHLSIFGWAGSWLLLRLSSPCGEQGPLPSGCARASHCGGLPLQHSLWGMKASVVAAPGVLGIGSVVVKHGLSCSTAWGIFPDQGLNPCLQHWQAHSLPLSHRGSPGSVFIDVVEKINEWVRESGCPHGLRHYSHSLAASVKALQHWYISPADKTENT